MNKVEREDLLKINLLNDVVISHNGEWVAYVRQNVLEKEPYYRSVIVVQEIGSGKTVEIVSGDKAVHAVFSEDDRSLFFLGQASGIPQLYRYDIASGGCGKLTSMHRGVKTFVPGMGDNLCFLLADIGEQDAPEDWFREMTEAERRAESEKSANSAKHITSFQYRMDGQGYREAARSQIFVLKRNGIIERPAQPEIGFTELALSPQGNYLAALSEPAEDAESKPEHNMLWGFDLREKTFLPWTSDRFVMQWPVWAEDEEKVYFCGHDYRLGWNTLFRLYEYDLKTGECSAITEKLDVEFVDSGITDIRGGSGNRGLKYCRRDRSFYFLYSCDGSTYVAAYRLADGTVEKLTEDRQHIFSFDLSGQSIAYIFTDPLIPNDIALFDRRTREKRILTECNREYLSSVALSVPQPIQAISKDGLEIHGFVMKPTKCEQGKKYPAILEIHGGPSLMYAYAFMHEFQYLAARGYVVFYCNPRGGSGRGQEFEAGIIGAKGGRGTNDFWDLMAITDVVEKLDYVDGKHIGVTGGSYGGLMTNWVVTHTSRYQAAITQRSIVNLVSFRGTSDLGFVDPENSYQVDFFDDEYLHSMSPLTYAKNVETPLCILHSENDYRCPVSQAQELFSALKYLGKTVEMYLFPNSSHGLSRNGQYPLRIQRLEIIREWFDRFLK